MADAPRMTVNELKRRMDAGEDFTIIDTRNPTEWAESDTDASGGDPDSAGESRR
jgi:rhodanese-related sulfurtransferase